MTDKPKVVTSFGLPRIASAQGPAFFGVCTGGCRDGLQFMLIAADLDQLEDAWHSFGMPGEFDRAMTYQVAVFQQKSVKTPEDA